MTDNLPLCNAVSPTFADSHNTINMFGNQDLECVALEEDSSWNGMNTTASKTDQLEEVVPTSGI